MLHDMQEDERKGRRSSSQTDASPASLSSRVGTSDRETVDAVLKSMSNAEIADLLRAEGIDHHEIGDREQFFETARQVLLSKLGARGSASSPCSSSTTSSSSTTRTVMLLAAAWTLMRLYSTGGFAVIGRLLLGVANATDSDLSADAGLFG